MGRGRSASKQLDETNAAARGFAGEQKELSGQLRGEYGNMMNQGYSPQEKEAQAIAGQRGVKSVYGGAGAQLDRGAARSRNDAGVTAGREQLALGEAEATGNLGAGLEMSDADRMLGNRMFALQGLGRMRGEDIGAEEHMYGLGPGLLEAQQRQRAAQNQGLKDIIGTVQGTLGTAAGAMGGGGGGGSS